MAGGSSEFLGKCRSRKCELGLLHRADGSARFQQGSTSVLAAVYGPVEVKQSKEKVDRAVVDITVKAATGLSGVKERALEDVLHNTCEQAVLTRLHPHASINVILQVEKDDGALLSCLHNAACMALVDGGVAMSCMFGGVTCSWDQEGTMVLDPDLQHEVDAKGVVHLALDSRSQEVITTHTQGCFTIDQLEQSVSVAKSVSSSLLEFCREAVERKLSKEYSKLTQSSRK